MFIETPLFYLEWILVGILICLLFLSRFLNISSQLKYQKTIGGFVFIGLTLSFLLLFKQTGRKDRIRSQEIEMRSHQKSYCYGIVNSDIDPFKKWQSVLVKVKAVNIEDGWVKSELYCQAILQKGNQPLRLGSSFCFYSEILPISKPMNPGQIDLTNYYFSRKIYCKTFIDSSSYILLSSENDFDLQLKSRQMRNKLALLLDNSQLNEKYAAFMKTLLLGDRKQVDEETQIAFKKAGVVHVMAVSGLHVGTLYFILNFLFRPLARKFKFLKFLLSLLAMWSYALLTGLSPSVTRAVLMLSLILLGERINARKNSLNLVAASCVALLIWNPHFINDVGFVLSYLAVFGIILIYPKLYQSIYFNWWLFDKLWSLTCLSLSAQISVLPLSIHLFGNFPTYFLIANIIVVPLIAIVFYLGLALLVFNKLEWVEHILSFSINFILNRIQAYLTMLNDLPLAVFNNLYITDGQMKLVYVLMLSSLLFLYNRIKWGVFLMLLTILGYQLIELTENRDLVKSEIWVYSFPKGVVINILQDGKSVLLPDPKLEYNEEFFRFNIKEHNRREGIKEFNVIETSRDTTFNFDAGRAINNDMLCFISWKDLRLEIIWKEEELENKKLPKADIQIFCRQKIIEKQLEGSRKNEKIELRKDGAYVIK